MKDIVLLSESLVAVSLLSDAEAGILLKALIAFTDGKEPENLPDRVALVFPLVSGQVERMWALKEKNRANGMHGGRPRKNPEETQTKPKQNPTITQMKPMGFESENPNETQPKAPKPKPIPKPNIEREREKKEKVDLPDTGIWADTDVREAFKEYAKMRVRIKKSLTPEAVKRKIPQLERLADTAHEAVEIIHTATDNCWLDFYAPRDNKPQKANQKQTFNFTERKTDYEALLDSMGV